MRSPPTRKLVLLIVLSALCVGIQLTPRPPNIEFTSLVVFLVGAVFGISFGATLGILVMLINGFFSPWGFAGFLLPFQILGVILFGVGGSLYNRSKNGFFNTQSSVETAILGAFLTLLYDVITNIGVALTYLFVGTPIFPAFVSVFISGALFSLIHIISNAILFGLVFYPTIRILQNFLGGDESWKKELTFT